MIKFVATAASLFLLFVIFSCATDSTISVSADVPADLAALKAEIIPYIEKVMARDHLVGLTLAFVDDGKPVWTQGFGYADKSDGTPVSVNTLFAIGSVSKTMTGLLAMKLAEEGKLDIDAPITKYIPEFTVKNNRFDDPGIITCRNIMTHHSGLTADINVLSGVTFPDIVPLLSNSYLCYPASTVLAYSNAAFSLLGTIIQRVAGEKFEDFAKRVLFDPAGMTTTGYGLRADTRSLKSNEYSDNGELAYNNFWPLSLPAGFVYSSAAEMANYIVMLLNGGVVNGTRVVNEKTLESMLTVQNDTIPRDFGYNRIGLVWFHWNRPYGPIWMHDGSTITFQTDVRFSLDQKFGVFLSCNTVGSDSAVQDIADLVLRKAASMHDGKAYSEQAFPQNNGTIPPYDRNDAKSWEGVYCNYLAGLVRLFAGDSGFRLEIGKMSLYPAGTYRLVPFGKNRYRTERLLLGFIPAGKLGSITIQMETIGKERFIVLTDGPGFSLDLLKVEQTPIPEVWSKRVGTYKAINGTYHISVEDGFLVFSGENSPTTQLSSVITIIDDTHAYIAGYGRYSGETLEIDDESGAGGIRYLGMRLYKVK